MQKKKKNLEWDFQHGHNCISASLTLLCCLFLQHDTCPVCRKSLSGEDSGNQPPSEPSSVNPEPRTQERWSYWERHPHMLHFISALSQPNTLNTWGFATTLALPVLTPAPRSLSRSLSLPFWSYHSHMVYYGLFTVLLFISHASSVMACPLPVSASTLLHTCSEVFAFDHTSCPGARSPRLLTLKTAHADHLLAGVNTTWAVLPVCSVMKLELHMLHRASSRPWPLFAHCLAHLFIGSPRPGSSYRSLSVPLSCPFCHLCTSPRCIYHRHTWCPSHVPHWHHSFFFFFL